MSRSPETPPLPLASEPSERIDAAPSPVQADPRAHAAPEQDTGANSAEGPSLTSNASTNTAPSKWKSLVQRSGPIVRHAMVVLALLCGVAIFLYQVNPHYPIKHWIFWTYAKTWGYIALFAFATMSAGHLVVGAIGGKTLPLRERAVISFACGIIVYFAAMFVCGVLDLYNRVFAVAFPIVVAAPGSVSLFRHVRRSSRHYRALRARTSWRPSPLFQAALLFGIIGIGLIYFSILSPRNTAYDAYFYHLGLAQQYVVEGGIHAAPEGWAPACLPHLSSILYAWAFLLPGLNMAERVICAAHVEFVIFLMTLASVPVLVRKLVPRARTELSWAAFFLFPGIFVYDSTLSVAADHILGFWAIPIFLMLLRSLRSLDVVRSNGAFVKRNLALLATFLAGAVLTKYQAMYLIAFPIMAIAASVVWGLGRAVVRHRELLGPTIRTTVSGLGVAIFVGLLVSAPHWLKNLVWYGDPVFPYLSRYVLSPKWVPDTYELIRGWDEWDHHGWRPQGTPVEKLRETAQAMVMFSFQPHDWAKFHGKVPVFGSLFTLSVLVLPFLRKTKRIWALFIATEIGIAIWYVTLHQDRYLQALVPWMVCVVAATLALLWQLHWSAKPFVSMLVAVQIVWGGDAYFIPAHAMTGNSAAPITAELLSMGMKGKHSERFTFGDRMFEIGRDTETLPPKARVLLHEHDLRFGLWRSVVSDRPGAAYAYRYEMLPSPAAVHERLRAMGVTHIITRPGKSAMHDTLGADLQFAAFIDRDVKLVKKYSDWGLYLLADSPPTRSSNNVVAYLACGNHYGRGLHKLSSLSVHERQVTKKGPRIAAMTPMPTNAQELSAFMAQADFAVTDSKCKPPAPPEATQGFVQIATRDAETLWVRVKPTSP